MPVLNTGSLPLTSSNSPRIGQTATDKGQLEIMLLDTPLKTPALSQPYTAKSCPTADCQLGV